MSEERQTPSRLELTVDAGDNIPEPDDSASVRAERGSPTPSCVTLDASHTLSFSPFKSSESDPAISTSAATGEVPKVAVTDSESEINSEFLAKLIELGFDDFTAALSLKRTANHGVEAAVNWIVDHSNASDFDEEDSSSDSEDEEDEDMGATGSSPGGQAPAGGLQDALMKAVMTAQKSSRTHKMVLVANMGLKMGTGKMAAQVGHATLAVYRLAESSEVGKAGLDSWFRHGQVKIVVKGKDTEELMDLFKSAKDAGLFAYLVQDAGYTQIPPGSRTVLGVFGEKEKVDSITGHLRLL